MRTRILGISVLLVGASLAVATVMTNFFTVGTGSARNETRTAHVAVNAARKIHAGHNTISGSVLVEEGEVKRFHFSVHTYGSSENVSEMSGPGTMRLPSAAGPVVHHGRGFAVVRSNRHAGEAGDMDVISVKFIKEGSTTPIYMFEGRIATGDLAVGRTISY